MNTKEISALRQRLMRDVREFALSGISIVERTAPFADATSLRAAANQFRQAAKALDELDGIEQVAAIFNSK